VGWNLWVYTFENLLVQACHIIGTKRRSESNGFKEDAPKGPNVRLRIIWLITPYLRTSVVRRPGLGVEKPFFGNFRHIHVPKFG